MRKTVVITGAMGSGKTEVALQIAEHAKIVGEEVTLIDLDFVNPYYRSVDKREVLERMGIRLLAPENTTIDTPLIADGTSQAISSPLGRTIVDLGGDPSGATVIAQFASDMKDYDFFAVINFSRIITENMAETEVLLREIELASRLKITGLISNTHLKEYTTKDIVLDGLIRCKELGNSMNLPVLMVTVTGDIAENIKESFDVPLLVIKRKLTNIWDV